MYNKTIIRFGIIKAFKASADNTYLDLDYSRYHKNFIQ